MLWSKPRTGAVLPFLVLSLVLDGAAAHAQADCFVSSFDGDSVLRYDSATGQFPGVFAAGGGLDGPSGLAFGPDGNLYVTSYNTDSVLRYDGKTGAFLDTFVPPGSGGPDLAQGLVFGPDGNLYVIPGKPQVWRYDGATGALIDVFAAGGLVEPSALAFGPDGNLYVSDFGADDIKRFDGATGALIDVFASGGGLDDPLGFAFGPDGNLYVSSAHTDEVLRFDGTLGTFVDTFVTAGSGGLENPVAVVFMSDGTVYVNGFNSNNIGRFDAATGAFIEALVPPGSGGLSGAAHMICREPPVPTAADFPVRGQVRGDGKAAPEAPFGLEPQVRSLLDREVRQGRIDPEVAQALKQQGWADAILVFDISEIRRASELRRVNRGLATDDAGIVAERSADIQRLKAMAHGAVKDRFIVRQDFPNLPLEWATLPDPGVLSALLSTGLVTGIRQNHLNRATFAQSLPLIRQPFALQRGFTGAGTSVAVLDKGLDYRHPFFGACTCPGSPASTCKVPVALEIAPDDGELDDVLSYHGTNVSSIVLAVAPEARVLALDVFRGEGAEDIDLLEALDWVLANRDRYHIVAANLSLGHAHHPTPCTGSPFGPTFGLLRDSGVLPIVAAGNFGFERNSQFYRDGIQSPACAPGAVSVGAVYDANVGPRTFEACADPTTGADQITCYSQSASYLSVLAPGSLISSVPTHNFSGTSAAAPHVAGAVAAFASRCWVSLPGDLHRAIATSGPLVGDLRTGTNRSVHRLDLAAMEQTAGVFCGPSPPLRLRVRNWTLTTLELEWDPPEFGAVTSYELEYRPAGSAGWTTVQLPSGARVATIAGLLLGDEVTARVTACFRGRLRTCSAPGWELDVALPFRLPNPPTDFSLVAVDQVSARVGWRDTSSDETHFNLRLQGPGSVQPVIQVGPNTTSALWTGLQRNTVYMTWINACNLGVCTRWTGPLAFRTAP